MRFLILPLAVFLVAAEPPPCQPEVTTPDDSAPRVVGGDFASSGDVPWQVSIQYAGTLIPADSPEWQLRHSCGGALVRTRPGATSTSWVLTAAHCVQVDKKAFMAASDLRVAAGGVRLDYAMLVQQIDRIVVNPGYRAAPRTRDDIALVHLAYPVRAIKGIVDLIDLPDPAHARPETSDVTVSGWGRDDLNDFNPVAGLRVAVIRTRPNAECVAAYKGAEALTDADVCVGSTATATCSGDSGGPVVWKDNFTTRKYLVAVVSRGKCGATNLPSIYTNVAHFLPWIMATTAAPATTRPRPRPGAGG